MITTPKQNAKTTSVKTAPPQTYAALRTAVRRAIALGKDRALQAVEREKVRTSWEIGKLILEHVLLNKDRADYGQKVVEKLGKDLGVSIREMNYMLEFAREYPIQPPAAELSWSHYRELLSVNEVETRKLLTTKTLKNDWSREQLRSEIKKTKAGSHAVAKPETLKARTPDALDVFRTREVNGKPYLDLGFSTYLLKSTIKQKLRIVKDRNFTYRAEVESVVDGDTLWCLVDLGLGVNTRQKLRLAHLNAPELPSKDGIAAKRFLSGKLKKGTQIIIATTKSDKFDRYLADVWTTRGEYLNQSLVEGGFANVV